MSKIFGGIGAKSRKNRGVFKVKSRKKIQQVRENWSQHIGV